MLYFELSIINSDKGIINQDKVLSRASQLWDLGHGLIVTRLPTFAAKSWYFPSSTFCVGSDTIERVNDLKYYRGSEIIRDAAFRKIKSLSCKFLVFERNGKKLSDLKLNPKLENLCMEAAGFVNSNISSTEIRKMSELEVCNEKVGKLGTNEGSVGI